MLIKNKKEDSNPLFLLLYYDLDKIPKPHTTT